MKTYFYHIKLFSYRVLLLIGLFSISRVIFYFFNFNYFSHIGFYELIKICIAGIRFDISAIFYFNILFILLSILPGNFKNRRYYQKIVFIVFISVNTVLLATNYIDAIFFEFENKRLTYDVFSTTWLGKDFINLLPRFIIDFWYLILIWIFNIYVIYKFYPRLKIQAIDKKFKPKTLGLQTLLFVLILALGLAGGRGGLQLVPLRVIHAANYTSVHNIPLVLNSPFTIMKSMGKKPLKPKKYFNASELDSLYNPVKKYKSPKPENYPNVVIIILEGFSKDYVGGLNNGLGYTPFIDSLINHSLVFTNAYSNGKLSIEAIPSILAGLPDLIAGNYITSEFANNHLNALPNILKEVGYTNAFFHGGLNGTFSFDQFSRIIGFEKYYGRNEYTYKEDFDGYWGIYDEPFLQFFGKEISKFQQPFFASLFTLSSHHPYNIPDKYKGKFPKGTLDIHESIGYADYSLKQFFKSAQQYDWYSNTLFVLVSDHTAQAEKVKSGNNLKLYEIPIIFYHPTDNKFKGKSEETAQQIDIFPTILDYIGYNKAFISYGNSLFCDTCTHFYINYSNGIFQLTENNSLLQFDGKNTIGLYDLTIDKNLSNNLINQGVKNKALENKLKAIIQSYQERMVSNRMNVYEIND